MEKRSDGEVTTELWRQPLFGTQRHGDTEFFCLLCAMGFRILCRLWERQSLNPHDIVSSSCGKRARGQPLTLIWPWESQVAGYEWRDLTTVSVKGNWVKYGIYGLLIINH